MKKFISILCLILIVCVLTASCASNKKATRKQVACPAYGHKSNNFERLPY